MRKKSHTFANSEALKRFIMDTYEVTMVQAILIDKALWDARPIVLGQRELGTEIDLYEGWKKIADELAA